MRLFASVTILVLAPVLVGACRWPESTTYVFRRGFVDITTTPDEGFNSEEEPQAPRYLAWLRRVRTVLGSVDQETLLQRQQEIFRRFGEREEVAGIDAILSGTHGLIRPVRCLESLLYAMVFDNTADDGVSVHDREFLAYVIEKPGQMRILYTWGGDGSVSPTEASIILDGALSEGWALSTQLHNHPFRIRAWDTAGTVIPSRVDLNTFLRNMERRGLAVATITNGYCTGEYQRRDVEGLITVWESDTRR